MKRLGIALALAGAVCVFSAPAGAQIFGQFTSAETLPVNGHLFGGYLNASENVLGGLVQLRLSFYPGVDFGFNGGLSRLNTGGGSNRTILRVGGDVKFAVAKRSDSYPVDVAIGGALGVESGDDVNVLTLGPTAVASRAFAMGANGGFAPYAGLGLLFSHRDALGLKNSDFSLPIRLGAELRVSTELRIIAEVHLRLLDDFNDDVGFATGVNMPF